MIPYSRQDIGEAEEAAVMEVLRSNFLTQGAEVPRFENNLANHVGARYCIAVSSATAALETALFAINEDQNKKLIVWTSPITFVATSNSCLRMGHTVDFVDIDRRTFNISVSALEEKLATANSVGKLPDVVIVVHFAGLPCDMTGVARLSRKYSFKIIEDSAHALGARTATSRVGSCENSDICIFSFHPVKSITSGEGGALLTNNSTYHFRAELYRSHGITKNPKHFLNKASNPPPWYYEQQSLGTNFRMTDIQAAIGNIQLGRLSGFVKKRKLIDEAYRRNLGHLGVAFQAIDELCSESAYHLSIILVPAEIRLSLFRMLRSAGIGVQVHYIPVYRQPYYEAMGFSPEHLPNAEAYYSRCISLPNFPTLKESDRSYVEEVLVRELSC